MDTRPFNGTIRISSTRRQRAITGIRNGPVAAGPVPSGIALNGVGGGPESIPPSHQAHPSLCLPFSFCICHPIICQGSRGSHFARDQGGGGRLFVAAVDAPTASEAGLKRRCVGGCCGSRAAQSGRWGRTRNCCKR